MGREWDDDDMFSDDLEDDGEDSETGDDGEDAPKPAPPVPAPSIPVVQPLNLGLRLSPKPAPSSQIRKARRVRVKPMSAGMKLKWPEVATCLLTLDNGRQILFVR
jgi:hypothetical protein